VVDESKFHDGFDQWMPKLFYFLNPVQARAETGDGTAMCKPLSVVSSSTSRRDRHKFRRRDVAEAIAPAGRSQSCERPAE
jgi:hypothetical protein